MSIFHHVAFAKVDPLANGLGDEIHAEQAEPEAIVLDEDLDETLATKWQSIIDDAHNDPEWVQLSKDF